MSILLDTGVWFGALHERDKNHEAAQGILAACMDGAHGPVYTTSDVMDEAFTLVLARTGQSGWGMVQALGGLVGFTDARPTVATVLEVSRTAQEDAWSVFQEHYEGKGLSLTDCTTLVMMEWYGIDAIASFDEGFDGLVERISRRMTVDSGPIR